MAYLGSFDIDTLRMTINLAPESIKFSVDLDTLPFSISAPTGGAVFDARKTRIEYVWDFGDATGDPANDTWNVTKVLPQWNRRNKGHGWWVAHLYRNHGTYTVKCIAIDTVTGDTATGVTTVTINDPDAYYPTTQTILVNNVGDTDFSAGLALYPSAQTYNTNTADTADDFWNDNRGSYGTARRFLFKRGAVFTSSYLLLNGHSSHMTVGDYGDPEDPRPKFQLNTVAADPKELFLFYCTINYGGELPSSDPDLRVSNIIVESIYDSTQESVAQVEAGAGLIWHLGGMNMAFSNILLDGLEGPIRDDNGGDAGGSQFHADNMEVRELGNYALYNYGAENENSFCAYTGCTVLQTPGALNRYSSGGSPFPTQATHRSTSKYTYFEANEISQADFGQSILEVAKTAVSDGFNINIQHNWLEGGNTAINITGNASQGADRYTVHNALFQGNIWRGWVNSQSLVASFATGLIVRSNLAVIDDVPSFGNAFDGMIVTAKLSTFDTTGWDATIVGAAPVHAYGNTMVYARDVTNTNLMSTTYAPVLLDTSDTGSDLTNVDEWNNVLHVPNLDNDSPDVPITDDAPLADGPGDALWSGNITGYTDPNGSPITTDTDYAVPALLPYFPKAGSAAIGDASGVSAVLDVQGLRHKRANRGCWR